MVAVIERDRRLARQLQAALEARGCRVRIAHGYQRALALFAREVPRAIYVSELLQRLSGGDLLVVAESDGRLARVPTLVRVSREDSVFARSLRRGGICTVVTPLDVERTAALLVSMASGDEEKRRRRTMSLRARLARKT
jgi:DNA-binding response OmpR family regulator